MPTDLSDVVEVSVWNTFQLLQLRHFIHHFMQVKLGSQEIQPSVAVGFPTRHTRSSKPAHLTISFNLLNVRWPVSNHSEHIAQVYAEGLQVWVRQAVRLLVSQGLSVVVNVDYAVLHLQLVVEVLRNALHGVRVLSLMRVGPDVCRSRVDKIDHSRPQTFPQHITCPWTVLRH